MVGVIYVYVDTVFGFIFSVFFFFKCLVWGMFEHDCLDTCCFDCLICVCFVVSYLLLFSATEHVSHGKEL